METEYAIQILIQMTGWKKRQGLCARGAEEVLYHPLYMMLFVMLNQPQHLLMEATEPLAEEEAGELY